MHVFLYLFLLSDKKGDVQKKGLDRRSHHIRISGYRYSYAGSVILMCPPIASRSLKKSGKVTAAADTSSIFTGFSAASAAIERAIITRWSEWPATVPPCRVPLP